MVRVIVSTHNRHLSLVRMGKDELSVVSIKISIINIYITHIKFMWYAYIT